jgi:hypothetical protein
MGKFPLRHAHNPRTSVLSNRRAESTATQDSQQWKFAMAAKRRASPHWRYFSASVHRYLCGISGLAFDHEPFVIGWISSMRGVIGFNWNQNQIRKSLVMIAMAPVVRMGGKIAFWVAR